MVLSYAVQIFRINTVHIHGMFRQAFYATNIVAGPQES